MAREHLGRLIGNGPTVSTLVALLVGLESEGPSIPVIDMVEQGLDWAAQEAQIAYLPALFRSF